MRRGVRPDVSSTGDGGEPTRSEVRQPLRVHVERIDALARGHKEAIALHAAEAHVCAAFGEMNLPDRLGRGREDAHAVEAFAAAPAAPEIAFEIEAETVGNAGATVDEDAAVRDRSPVIHDIEHVNASWRRA